MSFTSLPPELYSAILSHVDDDEAQRTTLALTRALPLAPIPLENLFSSICLREPQRVVQLHRRLRAAKTDARYVREFRLETWTADAQVVINVLALLDSLTSLALFVGPNFAPEDLLEVLERPRERLQDLSLRFRPYVQRANYYQFLKGAYFDSTLSALSHWPSSSLRTLSIAQDPHVGPATFAQPLVFFTFQPLLALSTSPAAARLAALRLRVPARDVSPFIAAAPRAFPALAALDLSTGNIRAAQLARLLERFARAQHVRLDACALHAPDAWAALGTTCALAGARRARAREKALRASQDDRAPGPAQHRRAPRAGRKGLAAAAISLRGAADPVVPVPAPAASSSTARAALQKIRIAPAPPSLRTLCTAAAHAPPAAAAHAPPPPAAAAGEAPANADPGAHHAQVRSEFARGWAEGVAQLRAAWLRLRTSQQNGTVRVMLLSADADVDVDVDVDGLRGLVDVESWGGLEDGRWPCPLLCLAGEGESALHVEGCGHSVSRAFWPNDDFFLRDAMTVFS